MTSILRLNKDRSSFFFKRNNSNDAINNKLDLTLPDISRLEPESFSDLFEHFTNYTSPDETRLQVHESPRTTYLSVPSPTTLPHPDSQTSTSSYPKLPVHQYNTLQLEIARNDSTGSSRYSQASQRESDYSPLVTRQSSSSSYTLEASPIALMSALEKEKAQISPSNPSVHPSFRANGSYKRATRLQTTSKPHSNRIPSASLNLDKPLPPGPKESNSASVSAPNLLLKYSSMPSKDLRALGSSVVYVPHAVTPATSHPERSASARRASTGQAISELPAWTPKAIREARSGKSGGFSHQRKRSASETVVLQMTTPTVRKRHTLDVAASSMPPTANKSADMKKQRNERSHKLISAATAENVILQIMSNLDNLQDLLSAAMVSKGFLRTFRRNESQLVGHIMFKSSRPAWELRRTILASQGLDSFTLQDCRKDIKTLGNLKRYIVQQSQSMCKPATIEGLLGRDEDKSSDVEGALWRIWTFCVLFGEQTNQTASFQTQIDWLNGRSTANSGITNGTGFGSGETRGLGTQELEDVSELWQCLQSLVAGFHGREQEARDAGIFDNWQVGSHTTEQEHMTEWTSYLLTLGPQTIVSVASCSFQRALSLSLTRNWPLPAPGQSRTSFLLAAISQVYQERVLEEAAQKAARFSMPRKPVHRPTRSFDERHKAAFPASGAIAHAQSLRVDTSVPKRRPVSTIVTAATSLEIRPDCDPLSHSAVRPSILPTSPSADPSVFYGLAAAPAVSAKLGATLFPMYYTLPGPKVPFQHPERAAAIVSDVIDPADKAMRVLVHELGFDETRARKALAMCDSGSGVDLQKAVELLVVDAKASARRPASPVELPTPQDLLTPKRSKTQSKTYCDGHCKAGTTTLHSRHRSTGTASTMSVSPISENGEKAFHDTIITMTSMAETTNLGNTVGRKAWRVLGKSDVPKRKNSILGIEEYQAKVERKKSMRATSGRQSTKVREGLSRNLLGLGLGIGSATAAKPAEDQLEHVRAKERLKKERPGTFYRPRKNASQPQMRSD